MVYANVMGWISEAQIYKNSIELLKMIRLPRFEIFRRLFIQESHAKYTDEICKQNNLWNGICVVTSGMSVGSYRFWIKWLISYLPYNVSHLNNTEEICKQKQFMEWYLYGNHGDVRNVSGSYRFCIKWLVIFHTMYLI